MNVCGVFGRNLEELERIHEEYGIFTSNQLAGIPAGALALVCVNDSSLPEVIDQIPSTISIAYTSGSTELGQFKRNKIGVFYPLQTFTKGVALDCTSIPILVESIDEDLLSQLKSLASIISSKVIEADSEQRFHLHVAAVMSNNFVNHLFTLSEAYLHQHQLDFQLLHPLIEETIRKMKVNGPKFSQTGPAKRQDSIIIEKHLAALTGYTKEMYNIMTQSIEENQTDEL